MSDKKPKFQIGDIVVISDTPTDRGSRRLEKLRFYTIVNCKKGCGLHVYQVNGLDTWFGEQNFDLYSRADNEWVPFKECNNIEVGDHVKLNYDTYHPKTSEDINKIFDIHEYRVISEIGEQYILVENEYYPIHPSFLLYRKPDVSQNKLEIDKDEGGICSIDSAKENVTETYVISDSTIIDFNYGENYVVSEDMVNDFCKSPKIPYYPALTNKQIFDAMQKTLDAAKYSAFPFGSPDYLMNVKFGGSYNKK